MALVVWPFRKACAYALYRAHVYTRKSKLKLKGQFDWIILGFERILTAFVEVECYIAELSDAFNFSASIHFKRCSVTKLYIFDDTSIRDNDFATLDNKSVNDSTA